MIVAYIGIGSNLNNPAQQVQTAIGHLNQIPQTNFLSASSLYQTKPWGFLEQPDFVNAVAMIRTKLRPQLLLCYLHQIEQLQERVRDNKRNQPRTLDLDLLLYGNERIKEENLTVPHPRMKERAFVLLPLAELNPNLRLPDGEKVSDLIDASFI